jgi:hypothetical protein
MPDEILLNEAAYAVWQTVKEREPIELVEIVKITGVDQAMVSAVAQDAAKQGFFTIKERDREEIVFAAQAKELVRAGLPEQLAARALSESGGRMSMAKFAEWAKSLRHWGGARTGNHSHYSSAFA